MFFYFSSGERKVSDKGYVKMNIMNGYKIFLDFAKNMGNDQTVT